MFTITIETDNVAFCAEDDDAFAPAPELLRCLARVSNALNAGKTGGKIMDTNGNKVGSWEVNDS